MPKKYWILFASFASLLAVSHLLSACLRESQTEKFSLPLDSTRYPKLEVVHTTMKPAWYQFFSPTVKLPPSPTPQTALAFVPVAATAPSFSQWILLNQTKQPYRFPTENGSLLMIQEAQDAHGKWRPVEYWAKQWGTGTMPAINEVFALPAQKGIMVVAPRYEGNLKTLFRFKVKALDARGQTIIVYSPTFKGSIAPSQFEISQEERKRGASYLE